MDTLRAETHSQPESTRGGPLRGGLEVPSDHHGATGMVTPTGGQLISPDILQRPEFTGQTSGRGGLGMISAGWLTAAAIAVGAAVLLTVWGPWRHRGE